VTPRDELLSSNRLGHEGAKLLYRTVRLVAVSHGFPPPEGSVNWSTTAVEEIAHDFLQGERGAKRLLDIAIRSTDEASFDRLLDAAVLNFLRDLARSTDMGKLILRVKEILRDEDEFEAIPGSVERWTLASGPRTASAAKPTDLASIRGRAAGWFSSDPWLILWFWTRQRPAGLVSSLLGVDRRSSSADVVRRGGCAGAGSC
jgi:hypothetical protein